MIAPLMILDNCSPTPVEETLADLLNTYPKVRCRIIRNPRTLAETQISSRCFELCETPWMWLLGDDDEPKPDAIKQILAVVSTHPEIALVNFASGCGPRKEPFEAKGLSEFVSKVDHLGNVIFISANVYSTAILRQFCDHGYHYAYSCAPQLVMVLKAMMAGSTCIFSEKETVRWVPSGWGSEAFFLGLMTVAEMHIPSHIRGLLGKKLSSGGSPLRSMFTYFLLDGINRKDRLGASFLFRQAASRYLCLAGTPIDRLVYPAFRLALFFPRFHLRWTEFSERC